MKRRAVMARYKCLRCRTSWAQPKPGMTDCWRCGAITVKWLNHELWTDARRGRAKNWRDVG